MKVSNHGAIYFVVVVVVVVVVMVVVLFIMNYATSNRSAVLEKISIILRQKSTIFTLVHQIA